MNVKKTHFTQLLIEANDLDPNNFQRWVFSPGMRFNSPDKWWGDLGRGDFPHEGIDFCFYRDDLRRIVRLDQKTRLPAMHNGMVRAIFNDYLGRAVVIEHDAEPSEAGTLVSIYAHTKPLDHIKPGCPVAEPVLNGTIRLPSSVLAKVIILTPILPYYLTGCCR